MELRKTKILWVNKSKEPKNQKLVVGRYFLGFEIGYDEVYNGTGVLLKIGQEVYANEYGVCGIVEEVLE